MLSALRCDFIHGIGPWGEIYLLFAPSTGLGCAEDLGAPKGQQRSHRAREEAAVRCQPRASGQHRVSTGTISTTPPRHGARRALMLIINASSVPLSYFQMM